MAAGWNLQLIVETWSQGGLIATRVGLAVAKSHTCERHACVVSNKQARLKYAERMGQERSFHTLLLPLNPHLLATFLHAHATKSSFLHKPFASPSFLHFRASSVVVFRDLDVDDLSPPPSSTSELVLPSSFATLTPMTCLLLLPPLQS
ncbi:hypothetical protein JHK87_018329 [Glycine soja]|nr:hypothetical protein JHK87_018329 [Glycine soja]